MSDHSTQQNGGLAEPRRVDAGASNGGGPTPPLRVALERPQRQRPEDVNPLWPAIRQRTNAIGFEQFRNFIDRVFTGTDEQVNNQDDPCDKQPRAHERRLRDRQERVLQNFLGVGAYNLLRTATEVFLLLECGVFLRESDIRPAEEFDRTGVSMSRQELLDKLTEFLGDGKLPYLKQIIANALSDNDEVSSPFAEGIFDKRVLSCSAPCLLELIWSYWHEEGMLVQSVNAIAMRFQNRRPAAGNDPLASLELDPLRGLNNFLWGYIQDEYNRLTLPRRAYEYSHHYGLTMYGKAVPAMRPADNRSKFIEAFHNLLYRCSVFFKEDDDTTVIADGFALLQALKEVHLILAEGAHNQFGDLPWTARAEMLIQQWMMARPEIRNFLQGRVMVPYTEAWMGQVDAMKRMQNWSDVTVTHFRDLAVYGEQVVLSVRYQKWISENVPTQAINWARYWRPEIQSYIHAYRAATGVDLTVEPVDTTMPGVLLRDRLAMAARRS
jgi:hypothetical protein